MPQETVRQGSCDRCLAVGGGISVGSLRLGVPRGVSRGQILEVWILAAKLPNSDLNFAVDLGWIFPPPLFPRKRPTKNPPQNSPLNSPGNPFQKNSPRISAEAFFVENYFTYNYTFESVIQIATISLISLSLFFGGFPFFWPFAIFLAFRGRYCFFSKG